MKVGALHDPAQIAGKIFLVVPLYFLALKAQLVVLVSAVVMISSLVSVLFVVLLLTVPPPRAQPLVKVGARAPVPHGVGATGQLTHLLRICKLTASLRHARHVLCQ